MKKKISLLIIGLLLASAAGAFSYKTFTEKFEITPKEKVLGEQEVEPTPEATPMLTPLPTFTPTQPPKPTSKPRPSNTPTSTPATSDDQQSNTWSTNSNVANTAPLPSNTPAPDNRPRDSHGNLCGTYGSYCKYECSITDYWVDDFLRILNNHIGEYLSCKERQTDCSIWENAVMDVYNKIYGYCKDSPKYKPTNPL